MKRCKEHTENIPIIRTPLKIIIFFCPFIKFRTIYVILCSYFEIKYVRIRY